MSLIILSNKLVSTFLIPFTFIVGMSDKASLINSGSDLSIFPESIS
nr:MAG TPA: hypothetical protein [Caudoviricetes sp.]